MQSLRNTSVAALVLISESTPPERGIMKMLSTARRVTPSGRKALMSSITVWLARSVGKDAAAAHEEVEGHQIYDGGAGG